MLGWLPAVLLAAWMTPVCVAQSGGESPVAHVAQKLPWEFGVLAQGGVGVTEDRSNFRFFMAGAHLGKVLTPVVGHGVLQGDFEYAGEVFPLWQAYTPTFQRANCTAIPNSDLINCSPYFNSGGTYTGASIIPIMLRWNLTHWHRVLPWVQGAGGVVWTNHKFPGYGSTVLTLANDGPNADTSVWNFTPQFGVGMHYFLKPRRSVDFSANAVHISSASLGDRNPGVNASIQISLGYSWWK